MGWRFRRSVSLGKGVRLNIGKRGVGLSVGVRGMRVGVGSRGLYTSIGIPGTGLYAIEYYGKQKGKQSKTPNSRAQNVEPEPDIVLPAELSAKSPTRSALWLVASLILLPINWIIGVIGIAWWLLSYNSAYARAQRSYLAGRRALSRKDYGKASQAFLRVLEYKPDAASVNLWLALVNELQENHEKAIQYFHEYLQVYPDDCTAKYYYATSLINNKEYEQGLKVLQSLSDEAKKELPVINAMAACFLAMDQPEMALSILEKGPIRSKKMNDDMMKFRYLLGKTYLKLGKEKQAVRQLSKVYAEDIEYADVKDVLEELRALS